MKKTMTSWALVGAFAVLAIFGTAAAKGKYTLTKVEEPDKKIGRLWKAKCASCHGQDGTGQTEKGKQMKVGDYTKADWQTSKDNAELKKAIVNGVNTTKDGVKQEMDGYKDLDDQQLDGLVQYIRWVGSPK